MSRSRRQSQPSEITLRLILSSLLWPDRLFSFAVQICIPQMDLKIKCTVNFLSRNSKLKFLVTQKGRKKYRSQWEAREVVVSLIGVSDWKKAYIFISTKFSGRNNYSRMPRMYAKSEVLELEWLCGVCSVGNVTAKISLSTIKSRNVILSHNSIYDRT